MAGGFAGGSSGSASAAAGKVKAEPPGPGLMDVDDKSVSAAESMLRVQTLGGRVKVPEEGDPVYMLAAFRDGMCYLARDQGSD